ncbi:MAG: DUF5047 domain-containing protein [Actinobacteria bacterium]|nr:DUF5047 domain-containing protein [Actinomycetota bacterium]
MFPISDEFAEQLNRSHTKVTKVEVLDSSNVFITDLAVTQGNVQYDRDNAIRRRCTATLQDATGALTPADAADLLHPLSNNRLRFYRGLLLPDGTPELVTLGTFEIFDSNVKDQGDNLEIDITGFDFAKAVQRARLLRNYHVPAGERYDLAIRDLLSFRVPTLQFNFPVVNFYTPPLTFGSSGDQGGGDPWQYATEMAEAVGNEVYFDSVGVCQLTPVPNPATDPVTWTYEEGELSTLLFVEKKMSKEDVYSVVVATGENMDNDEPVRYEAKDEDPLSPTYVFGPFGEVPFFLRSEYIRTVSQAQQVAEAKLRQSRGKSEGLQIITTPNPAHELGDIIEVKRARARVNETYVLDRFNIHLATNQSNNMTLRRVG